MDITHEMKSWSPFYDAIKLGLKKHDLRSKKDRDFKVSDLICLRRYDPFLGCYTGEEQVVQITFITSNDTPCAYSSVALARDYVILSIERFKDE